jgi:hypothetical protein
MIHYDLKSIAIGALRFFDYIFVANTDAQRPRSIFQSGLLTVGILVFLFIFFPNMLKVYPMLPDGHMLLSFESAVNRVYAAKDGVYVGPNIPIRSLATSRAPEEVLDYKLVDLPKLVDKSSEEYHKHIQPVLNNENALTYQQEFLIRLFPGMTIGEFGIKLNLSRLICLTVFVFIMIRLNVSVAMSFLSFIAGMTIIDIVNQTHLYSLYPNLISFVLLLIGFAAISLEIISKYLWFRLIIPFSIVIGVLGGILWNFRSSYLPVALVVFILFILYLTYELMQATDISKMRKRVLLGATCIAIAVGATAVQWLIVSSIPKSNGNYHYHVVWHPIVLGLAIPENEFAKAQGISWSDAVGPTLAKKINPETSYLGPTYERDLMLYYVKLWQQHPNEMANIYINKFKVAGMDALSGGGYFSNAYPGYHIFRTWISNMVSILKLFPDGRFLLGALLTIFGISLISIRCIKNRPMSFLFSSVVLAETLIFFEHAIIIPSFAITHFSFLLFGFVFCSLYIYQVPINIISSALHNILKVQKRQFDNFSGIDNC